MLMPSPAPQAPELTLALDAARAAMAERTRLLDLQGKLTADLKAAEQAIAHTADAVREADTDAILAGDAATPAMVHKAECAHQDAEEATIAARRLRTALAGLPARLDAADAAITTARLALEPHYQASRVAPWSAYEAELLTAAKALSNVLLKGHALAASTGHHGLPHLSGMCVPGVGQGAPYILMGSTFRVAEGEIDLATAWRRDVAASALYDQHAPAAAVMREIKGHEVRLERKATDEWHAKLQEDSSKPLGPQKWKVPREEEEYVPPKGTFVPRSGVVSLPCLPAINSITHPEAFRPAGTLSGNPAAPYQGAAND